MREDQENRNQKRKKSDTKRERHTSSLVDYGNSAPSERRSYGPKAIENKAGRWIHSRWRRSGVEGMETLVFGVLAHVFCTLAGFNLVDDTVSDMRSYREGAANLAKISHRIA